jgi:gliding motility-associated protein GldL
MSKKKGGFTELMYKTIMPKVYGIGAAVVIVGALFKILHMPGADEMLMIGLSTEAVIFFLSAFEPAHQEVDWSKVYPELAEEYEAPTAAPRVSNKQGASLTQQLDASLEKARSVRSFSKALEKG